MRIKDSHFDVTDPDPSVDCSQQTHPDRPPNHDPIIQLSDPSRQLLKRDEPSSPPPMTLPEDDSSLRAYHFECMLLSLASPGGSNVTNDDDNDNDNNKTHQSHHCCASSPLPASPALSYSMSSQETPTRPSSSSQDMKDNSYIQGR